MAPALFALFALLACARADAYPKADLSSKELYSRSEARAFDQASLLSGCLYEGRWHASGATVTTRETCLRCVCVRSALSCRRRACAPIMEPPPKRCHIRHRREACCPELICPDGIVKREHAAYTRFETDDFEQIDTPTAVGIACVEGGTVYAAGSAMSSNVACEQCFCLKGARKCVRPTCLPPPPHCVSRPTAGACCPQRYYCEYDSEAVKGHAFDCDVDGKRIQEGERIFTGTDCTACFCLKGAVRCQALACAPSLSGCQPVLRPGDCCAHQYKCEHQTAPTLYRGSMSQHHHPIIYNSLAATRNDDRALHMQKWAKVIETSTNKILPDIYTSKNTPIASATTNDLIYTIKVKRKTNELSNEKPHNDTNFTSQKTITSDATESNVEKTTEQPEGTVKIVINGTINCTAELSSTSLPLSVTLNDTDQIQQHSILPRIPIINGIEAQTYSPNDIITDRSVLGDFDENETFTINVTSSLNANTNSTKRPIMTSASMKPIPVDVTKTLNNSKKSEDYDYDYAEPTLPPSLPNLKIIPFVAADAVLDDDLSKESHAYPILERDDKFPVYYPTDSKESTFTRREEIYPPTQYPIFLSEKDNDYDMDLTSDRFPVPNVEYTVSTNLRNHKNEEKAVTKASTTSSTYNIQTPALNLFSPPVETEGGFIPKAPGIIDDYYAVYPSTPSEPAVPHLTTSMQLDIPKGACITENGKHVPEGENITVECSECICTWGQLRCAPTLCRAPPGCRFVEPEINSVNQCCGDIVCLKENKTATVAPVTEKAKVEKPKVEIAINNDSLHNSLQSLQLNNTTLQGHFLSTTTNTTNKQTHDKSIDKTVEIPPSRTTPFTDTTTKALNNNGSTPNITTVTITSTPKSITTMTTTVPLENSFEVNDTSSEYEDEEDMGFSFGSVLKLLLSDNYDSTTKSPNNKLTTTKPPTKPSPPPTTATRRPPSTVNPFIPLPSLPYNPPKIVPSTVNRIDHLVLGEATAIKRTTTKRPIERSTERPNIESTVTPGPRPPSFSGSSGSSSPGVGSGLLKLAGCNIYGRIYRVGRIIAELSTPCLECWCIEIGVECKKLEC